MIAPGARCLAVLPDLVKSQCFDSITGELAKMGVQFVILIEETVAANDRENEKNDDCQSFLRYFPHVGLDRRDDCS